MKTALLFPGLDALFVTAHLQRWFGFQKVCESVREMNRILSRLTGENEDLEKLILESPRPHLKDFDRTSIALTAIQIGIAKSLEEREQWDLIVGCSHGDLARSVICGVLKIEDVVDILWNFRRLLKDCPDGRTANVRSVDASPLSDSQLRWLESEGAPPSLWSSHHATIATETPQMEQLVKSGRDRNLKIKSVFPFAIHSQVMRPLALGMIEIAPKWKLSESKWPIFSSVRVKFLQNTDEIRSEAIEGVLNPIPWTQTLKTLRGEHGVQRFLNVGPSNALTGKAFSDGVVIDAWDLLKSGA